ncbi:MULTISPECIES: hypothetical protein [unclassified Paenibacillus]|uniref:hypothetical protein n=1 Tax=unclassified Paenibacillus TaxID=185978 RepID=UPI001C0F5919|nr:MULTISPECIES: hypothetical protein [unclassified Paenibacillus]MBU5445510.1 hypothetical protein [Paenibacillus sp. MSJ-34]CAH0122366.1 hypothetical protein PAE9249_04916 [Paenibacillus sp. CECT 9249]
MKVRKFFFSFLSALMVASVVMVASVSAAPDSGNNCSSIPSGGEQGIFAEDTSPRGKVQHVNKIEPIMVNNASTNSITGPLSSEDFSTIMSESLPFDFTFSFKANLTSRKFNSTGDSVTIEIKDSCWVDSDGYELDDQYFAIYLYTGDGDLVGYTLSMPVWCDGNYSSHSVTFDKVPKGDIYFVLSKPYTTYDYELSGYGQIRN